MRSENSGNDVEISADRSDRETTLRIVEAEGISGVTPSVYTVLPLTRDLSRHRIQILPDLPSFRVLGVRVHAVRMSDAVERLRFWVSHPDGTTHYVAATGMHGIAESRQSYEFRRALNTADLVVPDGMPLVWLGRIRGLPLRHRVCGADLMHSFCRATGAACRHFFFGGIPGVAEKLAQVLHEEHGIVIAGTYTPPFRSLTDAEEEDLVALLDEASPDVFWVGLSTPKQEKWMYEHRDKVRVPVMLGVGAAFDMNSGRSRRAPRWMRDNGLEWVFRLGSEPRRLWRRYLIAIPKAVWLVCVELLQARESSSARQGGASTGEKSTGEFSKS